MTEPVIRVAGLGKRYRLGEGLRHTALRNLLGDTLRAPLRVFNGSSRASHHPFGADSLPAGAPTAEDAMAANGSKRFIWALKDVNFEVHQGEVVGLIGSNGAGKSTLLKILARITRPTEGHAEIHGRVGSLLEVGTGFHAELTGRENVYMSGAILGMRKAEIDRKFDEIVAFSEVERFLETPLKHYSSGMQVRLAFAVAAHLEPEILFVDEVLSVGDASFQKKCLGKMGDVAREGRTILFVSHNMAAVRALCTRALLIRDGAVAASGKVADMADEYLSSTVPGVSSREWRDPATAPGNENVRISYIRIIPPDGRAEITIDTGVQIEIGFENLLENINLGCTVYLTNREGILVFESGHRLSLDRDSRRGFYELTGRIPGHLLNAGRYSLDVVFGKDQRYVLLRFDGVASFEVENTATGRGSNMSVAPGVVRPLLSWCQTFKEESPLVKQS
jgi:lipopolysaccharide transport system ATP-binding protein